VVVCQNMFAIQEEHAKEEEQRQAQTDTGDPSRAICLMDGRSHRSEIAHYGSISQHSHFVVMMIAVVPVRFIKC